MSPLNRFTSIKMKLGALVVGAVVITVFLTFLGVKIGVWPSISGVVSGLIAIVMVRFLARGLTSPLREMAAAANAMTHGNYDRRVSVNSRDEVGALAQAFNKMSAELAETDRVRRDLVANVSHELRTPITALQAALENIIDGVEPADPDTLRTMLAQVERLGRLVQQLLDLSRLESGSLPLERREFDVEPMLRHAVRETELRSPDVTLYVDVEPPDLVLDADPERLHQVVANLVENALRHSPSGGTVSVAARPVRDAVQFEVSDDGPGIPDADNRRVFERFYRADTSRSSNNGGAGLGLAIAQWIVDLHGGEIHPERRAPHGCRMVVTIPNRRNGDATTTPRPQAPLVAPVAT
ncbi:MAG TPA: ATP-binding protein [Acidimicrobiia bacterium]